MKKICIFLLLIMVLTAQFTFVHAIDLELITKVTVSGLDSPYTSKGILDTNVELTNDSNSLVSSVGWDVSNDGIYIATIVVRPGVYKEYSETTTATVNGSPASSVHINDKGYLVITYVYPQNEPAGTVYNQSTLTHIITVYHTTNGSISPKTIRAPHGKNFTVTITPDEGYEVKDVIVDGVSVGAVTEYTFKKVKEPHKIRATFKPIEGYEFKTEPIEFNRENVKWAVDFAREILASLANLNR